MTGAIVVGRHHRARRRDAEGQVGPRPDDLPRPDDGRLPEPVHDHRPGQPVGAVEHDGVDRAARRLGRRLPRRPARRTASTRSSRPRRPRPAGCSTSTTAPTSRSTRRPTRGTWAPTCPASRGCSCPTSAASTSTGRRATRSSSSDYLGFQLAGPDGTQVQRRRRSAGCSPTCRWCSTMMAELGPAADRVDVGRRGPRVHGGDRRRAPARARRRRDRRRRRCPVPAATLAYRLYRPPSDGPHPIVVYFHGGGWVLGQPRLRRSVLPRPVRALGRGHRVGRLPPRARGTASRPRPTTRFAAVQWVADHAVELGGIPGQLAVAGWSAGGNVAAVVVPAGPRRRRARASSASCCSRR